MWIKTLEYYLYHVKNYLTSYAFHVWKNRMFYLKSIYVLKEVSEALQALRIPVGSGSVQRSVRGTEGSTLEAARSPGSMSGEKYVRQVIILIACLKC